MSTTAATAVIETERPRLVFFYDQRSRRAESFLAGVLQRGGNHQTFQIHRVEVGQRRDLAERFQIHVVPTLLVVADRKIQARLECPRGCKDIELLLRPWLHQLERAPQDSKASPVTEIVTGRHETETCEA
jgi:thioredoxin-like negative regulator of GroEL